MVFELGASGPAADTIGAAAVLGLVAGVGTLATRRTEDGVRRWLRAAAYFCACLVASWATGVLDALLTGPATGTGEWGDPAFVLALLGCIAIEVVAYGVIWPIGTYVLDRPRDPVPAAVFGMAWGVTEAQLLLAMYAVVEHTGWSRPAVVVAAFLVLSAFQGGWHALYWDIRVAPDHNDPAWNARKVLLCHVPNLLATLTFLAVYRAPLLFVLLQTISLVLSCQAMRFPRPARALAVSS